MAQEINRQQMLGYIHDGRAVDTTGGKTGLDEKISLVSFCRDAGGNIGGILVRGNKTGKLYTFFE